MTPEGLCMMLRYTGLSNNVKSILFSELDPRLDKNSQSAKVYAQAIWYFLEGLHLRQDDLLTDKLSNFKKFHVHSELSELIFYKSMVNDKWWHFKEWASFCFKLKHASFRECHLAHWRSLYTIVIGVLLHGNFCG